MRSAQQSKKDRLSLIVGVMCHDYAGQIILVNDGSEPREPERAKSRRAILRQIAKCWLDLIAPGDRGFEFQRGGKLCDKFSIIIAFPPARLMIQMYDHRFDMWNLTQEPQQRHAVGPAADANSPAPGGNLPNRFMQRLVVHFDDVDLTSSELNARKTVHAFANFSPAPVKYRSINTPRGKGATYAQNTWPH